MSKKKSSINVVVLGHANCGRATTVGHLIHKCGVIDKNILKHVGEETVKVSHSS